MSIGITELLLILVVVFVVFGAGKLPTVMKDLGSGIKQFRKGLAEDEKTPDKIEKETEIQK